MSPCLRRRRRSWLQASRESFRLGDVVFTVRERYSDAHLAMITTEAHLAEGVTGIITADAPFDPISAYGDNSAAVAARLGVDPGACVVLEDSFNVIKAAAAGGFNPVMIPDQDQPDEEIRNLLTACCDSLTDVIGLFENGSLSLKQP